MKPRQRIREKDVLAALESQLVEKQKQFQVLQEESKRLTHQHDLLLSLCDSLEHIIQQNKDQGSSSSSDGDQAQQELLLSLASFPISRTASDASTSSPSCPSKTEAVAPLGSNMLYLFLQLVLLPANPVASSITLAELQATYASTVQELSLSLHLYKAGAACQTCDPAGPAAPLQRIADVMAAHLHMLASLSQVQRGQLISFFLLSNNETGELLPAVSKTHHQWAVSQVELSRQQKQHIASGLPVFERLLEGVHQELRQLQSQVKQQSNMDCAVTHAALLDVEQKRASRLELLLQKEYLLRGCAACYVWGAMSWVQIARLHCLMWPYSPAPSVLVQLLHEELQQQSSQGSF